MSARLGLLAAGGVLLGSLGFALVLLLAPRGDGEAPAPDAPGALEPAAAEACVDWLLRALGDCADQAGGGGCTGRPLLGFELRVERGQGTLTGLTLQGGELDAGVWRCLVDASRRFHAPFAHPRGSLRIHYPVGCDGGRMQVLPPRRGVTPDPGRLPTMPAPPGS